MRYMALATKLSQGDVASLLADRSAVAQMEVAGKLTAHYGAESEGCLSDKESVVADDIFRLLPARAALLAQATVAPSRAG